MEVKISSLTDPGLVRTNNEDYHFHDSANGIVILADGVGGHDYGEVASKLAVECCYQYLTKEYYLEDTSNIAKTLMNGLIFANQQVIAYKQANKEFHDMGTTITCVHVKDKTLSFAWIGDSRVYVIDPSVPAISLLTTDHTLYNEMLSRGELAESYKKNVLTRMVGSNIHTQPESGKSLLTEGQLVLVCSDGLSDLVPENIILTSIMENKEDLDTAVVALIDLAKGQGGRDNITVALLKSD
jgi:PPM family protein phosphatase